MSMLSAFLHPVSTIVEKEVMISRRFVGETGEPAPFRIRSMTQEEMDSLVKKSTKTVKVNGQQSELFDGLEFNRRLIVNATVVPDFSAKEMCDAYGVVDPLLVPVKMLLPGEYQRLLDAITSLSDIKKPGEEESESEKN